MNEFFEVNKNKLRIQFLLLLGFLAVFMTVKMVSEFDQFSKISLEILIRVSAAFLVAFTWLMVFFTGIGYFRFRRTKKILENPAFEMLLTVGFKKIYATTGKWFHKEPSLKAIFRNYPVKLEIEGWTARLIIDFNIDNFTKAQMATLKEIFGNRNIQYDWLGVALVYVPSRCKKLFPNDVLNELNQLINFLETEKLIPWVEE